MLGFNDAICNLRWKELKLYGNRYTWSNNQQSRLLERLDWFFASVSWVANYPGSKVNTLSRDISDHYPCLVSISTNIPKAKVFRFENFWMLHDDFTQVLNHGWSLPTYQTDAAKVLTIELKKLRQIFREWQTNLTSLAKTIEHNKLALKFVDIMEEFRDLSLEE
jgi:hypothetical protein